MASVENQLEEVGRGVAHKLRSGLCALTGGLQLSLQQALPGPTREMLTLAERGAQHITEIVKDLVTLTQRPECRLRSVDVHLFLGEFLHGLRRLPQWAFVSIERRFEPDLPPLWADPDLLDSVVAALARNAIEAMADPQTEREPRWIVETRREADSVVLRFTDNGQGFSKESLALAFQPYFSTKSGHRGIGLSLARWLVHIQGGTTALENHPAGGAVVVLRFPLARKVQLGARTETEKAGFLANKKVQAVAGTTDKLFCDDKRPGFSVESREPTEFPGLASM